MDIAVKSFALARMSRLIFALTLGLLSLALVFLATSVFGDAPLLLPGLLLVVLYAWVWLRFRPTRFVIHPGEIEVIWPLKRRRIARAGISNIRLISRQELRRETGRCMRVGAGGLWGAFGWLWTQRRGIVQLYVSRTDGLVWIERISDRPWLITPESPEAFVHALSP